MAVDGVTFAMNDAMIHKTASRNYELKLGIYGAFVIVDGLFSPLITLQFGKVSRCNYGRILVLVFFSERNNRRLHCVCPNFVNILEEGCIMYMSDTYRISKLKYLSQSRHKHTAYTCAVGNRLHHLVLTSSLARLCLKWRWYH